jgi:hypothetical protein
MIKLYGKSIYGQLVLSNIKFNVEDIQKFVGFFKDNNIKGKKEKLNIKNEKKYTFETCEVYLPFYSWWAQYAHLVKHIASIQPGKRAK